MKLLLDTHILVWMATARENLSVHERAAIDESADGLIVSSISLWELRAKIRAERRRSRRALKLDPAGAIAFCARTEIPIDQATVADSLIALRVDPPHGDPFDEMLLVHAQRLGAQLLTRDDKLVGHPLAYPL